MILNYNVYKNTCYYKILILRTFKSQTTIKKVNFLQIYPNYIQKYSRTKNALQQVTYSKLQLDKV